LSPSFAAAVDASSALRTPSPMVRTYEDAFMLKLPLMFDDSHRPIDMSRTRS
jgi:hypothetical protein